MDYLDFTDENSLLSHKEHDTQEKLCRFTEEAERIALEINIQMKEVMRVNNRQQDPIQQDKEKMGKQMKTSSEEYTYSQSHL